MQDEVWDPDRILLFQFDSDDVAGWMWGDAGILWFHIRPSDLIARRFDDVRIDWSCC